MTTPLPPSQLLQTLARFRRETDKRDAATLRQLTSAYTTLYRRLQEQMELEARRIFEQPESVVTRAYITRRLSALAEQIQDELTKYQSFLSVTVDASTDAALLAGSRHALELMRLATLGQRALISIPFDRLNPEQVNTMIAFLSPTSPLYRNIERLARFHAPLVRDRLVEAIALGYNPYKAAGNIRPFLADIANKFQLSMARPFADAVRMARTAQLWAMREAARANYQANSDVISGWSWYANLDGLVCPACLSLHGSIHALDEELDGHPHCRCTPIPVVLGNPLVPEGAGLEWFNQQDEATQQAILGKGAYSAWKDGAIDFDRLHKHVPDETYGSFSVVPTLAELLGESG